MKKISLVMMTVFALNANVAETMIPEVVSGSDVETMIFDVVREKVLSCSDILIKYVNDKWNTVYNNTADALDNVKNYLASTSVVKFSVNMYKILRDDFNKGFEIVSMQVVNHPYIATGIVLGTVAVASTYLGYKCGYSAGAAEKKMEQKTVKEIEAVNKEDSKQEVVVEMQEAEK